MLNAESLKNQGNEFFAKKQFSKALEKYDEALFLDPKYQPAWINKALAHKNLNQLEAALTALNQLFEINPEHIKALFQKATILLQQGKISDAQILYTKILELDAQHIDAQLGLFQCDQQINAKLILGIIDLKLTANNEVKILEFGNYINSSCSGYEDLTGKKILDNLKQDVDLPPLLLALDAADGTKFAYDNDVHLQCANLQPVKPTFSATEIQSHRAIYAGWALKQLGNDVLKLGDTTMDIIFGHKTLTHDCFIAASLEHLRPKTFKIQRTKDAYNPSLVEQINKTMPGAKRFVIKSPEMSCGEGVIVIEHNELDIMLKMLLSEYSETRVQNEIKFFFTKANPQKHIMALERLRLSKPTYYLVEEYIPNKAILYNDKEYDGVMRVVFAFTRDNIAVKKIYPLAYYWKFPPEPIDSTAELRDRCVSSYTETHCLAAHVSASDARVVFENLKNNLPILFATMLQQNLFALAKKDFVLNKDSHLWQLAARSAMNHGHFDLAKYAFDQDKKDNPSHYLYLGIYYYLLRDYTTAIVNFTTAIEGLNKTEKTCKRDIERFGSNPDKKDNSSPYTTAITNLAASFNGFKKLSTLYKTCSTLPEAFFMRAISYCQLEDYDSEIGAKMESDFYKAVELDENYALKIDKFAEARENQLNEIIETANLSKLNSK